MTELDLPLLPSAEQIRRREFATVRRGYDPDQVRDYLRQVAEQVERLERELREAKLRGAASAEPAAERIEDASTERADAAAAADPYDALAKRMSNLIAAADREAATLRRDAEREAERLLEQARAEADRIRVDAQARAEAARQEGAEALASAREEADRLLSTLSERRAALVEQMRVMRERLLSVAQELGAELDEAEEQGGAEKRRPTGGGSAGGRSEELLDPRYEDLWVSRSDEPPGGVDIPDLATIDLDLDDDPGSG
jgi:DivIVA domain-containing protein